MFPAPAAAGRAAGASRGAPEGPARQAPGDGGSPGHARTCGRIDGTKADIRDGAAAAPGSKRAARAAAGSSGPRRDGRGERMTKKRKLKRGFARARMPAGADTRRASAPNAADEKTGGAPAFGAPVTGAAAAPDGAAARGEARGKGAEAEAEGREGAAAARAAGAARSAPGEAAAAIAAAADSGGTAREREPEAPVSAAAAAEGAALRGNHAACSACTCSMAARGSKAALRGNHAACSPASSIRRGRAAGCGAAGPRRPAPRGRAAGSASRLGVGAGSLPGRRRAVGPPAFRVQPPRAPPGRLDYLGRHGRPALLALPDRASDLPACQEARHPLLWLARQKSRPRGAGSWGDVISARHNAAPVRGRRPPAGANPDRRSSFRSRGPPAPRGRRRGAANPPAGREISLADPDPRQQGGAAGPVFAPDGNGMPDPVDPRCSFLGAGPRRPKLPRDAKIYIDKFSDLGDGDAKRP